MKIYEVVVQFLDPVRGVLQVKAETEEEAINAVRARLDGQVKELTIESVEMKMEDPGLTSDDLSDERTVN